MHKTVLRPALLRGKPYLYLRVILGSVKSEKAPATPQKLSADHNTAIQEKLDFMCNLLVKESKV